MFVCMYLYEAIAIIWDFVKTKKPKIINDLNLLLTLNRLKCLICIEFLENLNIIKQLHQHTSCLIWIENPKR